MTSTNHTTHSDSEKRNRFCCHEGESRINWFMAESKGNGMTSLSGNKNHPKCDIDIHPYFKIWKLCSVSVTSYSQKRFHFLQKFSLRAMAPFIFFTYDRNFICLLWVIHFIDGNCSRKENIWFYDLTHSSLRSMNWRCLMSHPRLRISFQLVYADVKNVRAYERSVTETFVFLIYSHVSRLMHNTMKRFFHC